MKHYDPIAEFLLERLKTVSMTEQEALAIALGFEPNIKKKIRFRYLENAIKSQNLSIRRSGIIGLAFSSILEKGKKPKRQQKVLKKHFKDPLSSIRITSALGQGINAYFTQNTKIKRKVNKEIKKKFKNQPEQVKQGLAVSMGLLGEASKSSSKDFKFLLDSYLNFKLENPTLYFIGFALSAINSGNTENATDFILESIIPHLTNKESRRITIICFAFLLPLISDPIIRMEKLNKLIHGEFEFQSKFGTDLAIIFTFFSLYNNKPMKKKFLQSLEQIKELDPDYDQIYQILSTNQQIMKILLGLIRSNTMDIKASGINVSFFLETTKESIDLEPFIKEGIAQRDSGYFGRFLILLRSFSFCLLEDKYSYASYFEPFIYSSDQQVKRIASLAYSCLHQMNPENKENLEIIDRLQKEQDENVRWGLIIGSSLPQIIGKSAIDDELVLGLLLLCLGFTEAGMSLILSQAMVPTFYQEKE
ncbi:hypothetical protein CEE45_11365 [Candidatus Heimdallarchaeota archaeon B3_Heim]|nr:MAG: hypothetical protein CEE45_11365 [Candidatus Heimdallarchaeota archaeon B3_Heim]